MSEAAECAITGYQGDLYVARVVFLVAFATVIPYGIVMIALFTYRRKKQPLVARPFRTTVACLVFMMLWITDVCLGFFAGDQQSCFTFLVLGWPLLGLTMNIYLSRVWLLWFKFKSTQEKSTLPPLLSVAFSKSALQSIRTRVRTYTQRGSSASIAIPPGTGTGTGTDGKKSNANEKVQVSRRRTTGETTRGGRTQVTTTKTTPAVCRSSTAAFSPSGAAVFALVETLEDEEFDASAEDSYNHAPTGDSGVGNTAGAGHAAGAGTTSPPAHTRSHAVTLTEDEFSKKLVNPLSEKEDEFSKKLVNPLSEKGGDTILHIDPDPSQAFELVGPSSTTAAPLSPKRSHFRGSRSFTSSRSESSQFWSAVRATDRGGDAHTPTSLTESSSSSSDDAPSKSRSRRASSARRSLFDKNKKGPLIATPAAAVAPKPTPSPKQTPINWYLTHKHYASDRFMLRWFGLKGAIEWLVLMAPVYTSGGAVFEEFLSDDCFCPSLGWALYAFEVVLGYHAVILGYAAWRFAQVSDGFYLKAEFKYISIICLLGIVLWNVLTFLPADKFVFPFSNFTMVITTTLSFSMSSTYPLWMSRKRAMRTTRSVNSISSSQVSQTTPSGGGGCSGALYAFLTETEGGLKEFAAHLQREFSIENLLFWQAVEQYHSEFKPDQPNRNRKLAVEIESRFINEQSELQVNLDSTAYSSVHESIASDKITVDMFDSASSHIFRLMATDSFVRFRHQRSPAASA